RHETPSRDSAPDSSVASNVASILDEVDPVVAQLSGVVGDLRSLPSETFKSALKVELMVSAGVTDARETTTRENATREVATRDGESVESRTDSEASRQETSRQERSVMSKTAPAPMTSGVRAHLRCRNAPAAIEFYKKVFGATEIMRLQSPDGRIGHAEL